MQKHVQKETSLLAQGLNPFNAYYVMDPENNLLRTRERLEGFFNETGWEGIVCQNPTQKECEKALTTKDCLMYAMIFSFLTFKITRVSFPAMSVTAREVNPCPRI